jgi:hypothetical protein
MGTGLLVDERAHRNPGRPPPHQTYCRVSVTVSSRSAPMDSGTVTLPL